EYFPQAQWQRCTVHFYRNVFSVVPSKHLRTVSDMLKAIHACEDREAALDRSCAVTKKLRVMRLKEVAARIEEGIEETLTFYSFSAPHWRRIRTNNPLERIMREIRRRTRVVGAFPDGQSALMLAAARLRHIAGTQWGTKRYLRMDLLRDLDTSETHVA
ncbi:MAG TPA: IS256 family transposase, partial [Gammaproteobacteria bacterium]|nr:IS256 family transposase [Gammaproteobacteria bacterium]